MSKKNQSVGTKGINSILLASDRKVGESKGPLTSIFRQWLLVGNWDVGSYSMAIDRWAKRMYPNDPAQQMSLKGNTNDQLAGANMTLHTFKRGLEILDPAFATLKFQAHTHAGKVIELESVLEDGTYREFWDPLYKSDMNELAPSSDENQDGE